MKAVELRLYKRIERLHEAVEQDAYRAAKIRLVRVVYARIFNPVLLQLVLNLSGR